MRCKERNCAEEAAPDRAKCPEHLARDSRNQTARRKRLGISDPACDRCGSEEHSTAGCPDRAADEVPTRVRLRAVEDPWPELPEDALPPRPRTRGECTDGPRPCPWVGCRYHLLGLGDNGRLGPRSAVLSPDDDAIAERIDALPETCALDVADEGRHGLIQIGDLLGVVRERVRQIEEKALAKMRGDLPLAEHAAEDHEEPKPAPPPVLAPRPNRTRKLTDDERDTRKRAILELHHEGLLQAQIGERLGLAPCEVSRTLCAEGIKQTRKGPAPHPARAEAWKLMAQGLGNAEIGRRLDVLPDTVATWRQRRMEDQMDVTSAGQAPVSKEAPAVQEARKGCSMTPEGRQVIGERLAAARAAKRRCWTEEEKRAQSERLKAKHAERRAQRAAELKRGDDERTGVPAGSGDGGVDGGDSRAGRGPEGGGADTGPALPGSPDRGGAPGPGGGDELEAVAPDGEGGEVRPAGARAGRIAPARPEPEHERIRELERALEYVRGRLAGRTEGVGSSVSLGFAPGTRPLAR